MGFFNYEEPKKKPVARKASAPKRSTPSNRIPDAVAAKGCISCPLNATGTKLEPSGVRRPIVYMLGETLSEVDEQEAEHAQDKAGQLLRRHIPYRWEPKLRWNNTLRCRTPAIGVAGELELACCTQYQVADIERSKPQAIFLLGDVPLKWITKHNMARMMTWRGRRIAVRVGSHVCWAYPMLAPGYVNRVQHAYGSDHAQTFKDDLLHAFAEVDSGTLHDPVVEDPANYHAGITCSTNLEEITVALESFDVAGFDVETNALRPYFPERKILTMAFSDYDRTIAFPYAHPGHTWSPQDMKRLQVVVTRTLKRIPKICHNAKMEMEWTAAVLGEEVLWGEPFLDTMAQAYVLDERDDAKGLDDLTVIHMGFNVKALDGRRVNTKNMEREPLSDILPYNALDAKYTFALHQIQALELERQGLTHVYDTQVTYARPLVLAQKRGLVPNDEAIQKLQAEFDRRLRAHEIKIQAHKDVLKFVQQHGPLVLTNNTTLGEFFHGFLGRKECMKKNKNGVESISVDMKVLGEIKHPVAAMVLEYRSMQGLKTKYMDSIAPDGHQRHADGLLHCNFNHLKTVTRRLSSDDPNMQNFPKRKERRIRAVIKARDGDYWMVSIDQGQIEARVVGMASKDRFLCKALWEDYDIHMEWAERVYADSKCRTQLLDMLADIEIDVTDKKATMKGLRQEMKNKWVFPLFFGSALPGISRNLQVDEELLKPHIKSFFDTFSGVAEWQEGLFANYKKVGYVETLNGFRRRAPMSYNELINEPIQGTACEIVMDGACKLSDCAHETGKDQLQIVLNVHDDLTFYFPEASLEDDIETAARIMCCVDFPFITVPLTVEVSVGKNWYEQDEVAKIKSTDYGFPRSGRPAFAR